MSYFTNNSTSFRTRCRGRNRIKSISVSAPFNTYWSGLVLRVGTGKDFTSLNTAVSYANSRSGALILIDPGTYSLASAATVTNRMIIRGLGNTPDDTTLNGTGYAISVEGGGQVLLENIKATGVNSWNAGLHCYGNAIVTTNKCHFYTSSSSIYIISGYNAGFSGKLVVKNSKLTRGYAHLFSINLSLIDLIRVELNNAMSTYQCSGSLVNPNTVTTPTVGYGYSYGSFYVNGVKPLM